jgi:hypothetical protein
MSQMTSEAIVSSGAERQPTASYRPYQSASHLLTWGVALSSVWIVIGLTLDGWAHTHELPDTFFTPWHGVIYSGVLLASLFLGTTFVRQRLRRQPMPTGYGLSLIGVGLFLLGGVADLRWRTSLGIEANLSAEYSPPHPMLAGAGRSLLPARCAPPGMPSGQIGHSCGLRLSHWPCCSRPSHFSRASSIPLTIPGPGRAFSRWRFRTGRCYHRSATEE